MRGNLGLFVCWADRERLAAIIADRNSLQKHVWRAQVVLLTSDLVGTAAIMRQTGLGKPSVWRWQDRYVEAGVDGLLRDKTRPSRIPPLDAGKVLVLATLLDAHAEGARELDPPQGRDCRFGRRAWSSARS